MSRFPRTILATCCVPWRDDDTVDEPVFRAGVKTLVAAGLRDLYIFGTAGEGYAVSDRQFDEVVRLFQEETTALGVPPMVGLISLSLPIVIERIERCLGRGITLFQISLPSWGALNDGELRTFFAETCGRFPDARFLHYNLRRSGRLLTPEEYAALAERHPNLVATKNSGADAATISELQTRAGQLRHFLTEGGYATGSLLGEFGFLVSIASINPALAREYFDAGVRRDTAVLDALGHELALLSQELKAAADPGVHMDGAYDKVFSKLHDPAFPLRLLPPYQGWSNAAFAQFRQTLLTRYPRWAPGLS